VSEPKLRVSRGLAAMRLAARGGARYAVNAPRLFAAAGEHRQRLRDDLALRTAQDVADTLGTMKGVLMKIGQLASYVDDGLAPPARRILGRLQDSVPPMSAELAAGVIRDELGDSPERIFRQWDPRPIAAASIGQVHRAITAEGQAVAVKVQYPGIAETIAADLGNVSLIRSLLKMAAPSQDVTALIEELRTRIAEELDYRLEADHQRRFAAYFDGHPTARVPKIVDQLSTGRVMTSELAAGARFAEMLTWSQEERDLAAETMYRFTFRSLYGLRAFNGDPHPGNYLFEPGGCVTFLDFGLVKRFSADELMPLVAMIDALCLRDDPAAFRVAMEQAGFLQPGAPIGTDQVVEHMALFYESIRRPGPLTMTSEYASSVARRYVDFSSPLAAYASIPRSYVIVQRINLGLFALLGEMNATADWRRVSEEIWPFVDAPPSTPLGEAEVPWLERARLTVAAGPRQGELSERMRPIPFGQSLVAAVSAGAPAGPERGHVYPVRAGQGAKPAGAVLRQVDQHVIAVVGRAVAQPGELASADDVRQRHRGVHRHPVGQRGVGRGGVHVILPAVVPDQLGQRRRLPEQLVDQADGLVLRHLPELGEARPQRAHGVQLGLVVGAAAGPPPLGDEGVERGHVRQLLGPAAGGVHQGGGPVQRHLRVMGKKHLTSFTTLR